MIKERQVKYILSDNLTKKQDRSDKDGQADRKTTEQDG